MTDLFGGTTCALDRKSAAGHVSDFTGGVWLCSAHLKTFELQWRALGRTVDGFLRTSARTA